MLNPESSRLILGLFLFLVNNLLYYDKKIKNGIKNAIYLYIDIEES